MSLLARFRHEQSKRRNKDVVDNGSPASDHGCSAQSPARGRTHPFSSPLRFPSGTPYRGRSLTPPAQLQRRRYSPQYSDPLEDERLLKKRKGHALDVCRENQLEDDALNEFAELDPPCMLIALQGKLLAIERERQQDEARTFIFSKQFKEILKDRLRTCLLSPNLTKYLEDLPEHVWGFMKRNLAVFKIPPKALEDQELATYIDSLMKDVLTKQRATMKAKLANSIKKQQHISQLAKCLSQKDFIDITTGQWARFAFLRQNMILFNQLVSESMAKKITLSNAEGQEPEADRDDESVDADASKDPENERMWDDKAFWEFVDSLLGEMRDEVNKEPSMERRKKDWEKSFNEALQDDLEMFPASNKSKGLRASDGRGIADWQHALHRELVW